MVMFIKVVFKLCEDLASKSKECAKILSSGVGHLLALSYHCDKEAWNLFVKNIPTSLAKHLAYSAYTKIEYVEFDQSIPIVTTLYENYNQAFSGKRNLLEAVLKTDDTKLDEGENPLDQQY